MAAEALSPAPAGGRTKLWMQVVSGRKFFPFNPANDQFTYFDMTFALSHINRFGGHAGPYSVLDHSLVVADIVAEHLGRPDLVAQALFHDFPEALYGDMIAPIRRGLPEYNDMYKRGELVIFKSLGLPERLDYEVRKADLIALAIEARRFFNVDDPVREWELPFQPIDGYQFGFGNPVWARDGLNQMMKRYGIEAPLW